jgi:hypothetical protein
MLDFRVEGSYSKLGLTETRRMFEIRTELKVEFADLVYILFCSSWARAVGESSALSAQLALNVLNPRREVRLP